MRRPGNGPKSIWPKVIMLLFGGRQQSKAVKQSNTVLRPVVIIPTGLKKQLHIINNGIFYGGIKNQDNTRRTVENNL